MRDSRLAWVFWAAWVTQLVLLVMGIWWAVGFFRATEVLEALKQGLPAATALILAMQLKVGIGSHLHTERVLREMKRLEIMVLARTHTD
jgi:Na+-transporting methylmalonyl-CoA/oxaloacetate decarboxylase beta subunit